MSVTEILNQVAAKKITTEEAGRLISAMNAKSAGPFSMKVSEKGCVQIRGLRGANVRFGFTAYPTLIQDLFANRETIEKFMEENKSSLSWGKSE